MSPPAKTPGAAGHHRRRHLHHAVAGDLDPVERLEEIGVALLAQREDDAVGREGFEASGRLRVARLVEFHGLDLKLRTVERGDGAQPVDAHAFALGVGRLLLVGRHLLAGAAVDDDRLFGAEPARHPGGVHRRVAAAVDRDPLADVGRLAGGHVAQEADGVEDRPGIARRKVDPLGEVRADRDEHGVEAALAPLGIEVVHPVAGHHAHAHLGDAGDLGVEHVTRHPVGGDPVTHHAAGLVTRVADLDLVAEPGEVIRR